MCSQQYFFFFFSTQIINFDRNDYYYKYPLFTHFQPVLNLITDNWNYLVLTFNKLVATSQVISTTFIHTLEQLENSVVAIFTYVVKEQFSFGEGFTLM